MERRRRLRAAGATPTERAVACAMDSPFGGIGWTRDGGGGRGRGRHGAPSARSGRRRSSASGCFDETLVRNQDDEFNLRLRRAGGRDRARPRDRRDLQAARIARRRLPAVLRVRALEGARDAQAPARARRSAASRRSAFVRRRRGSARHRRALAAARRSARARVDRMYGAGGLVFAARSVRDRGEPWALLPARPGGLPGIPPRIRLGAGGRLAARALAPARDEGPRASCTTAWSRTGRGRLRDRPGALRRASRRRSPRRPDGRPADAVTASRGTGC